jgi:tRNA threonylcarbamoyladenosine biosynthesis protein TsaB
VSAQATSSGPLLLAIECATREASVALARGESVLALRRAEAGRFLADSLLGEIDALLGETRTTLAEIEAFAVSSGPGAFTSLRIGVATVKGLAFGSPCPVAAVSTLAAIAHAARLAGVSGALTPLLDARRGEVYAAEFSATPGGEDALCFAEGVYDPGELASALSQGSTLVGEVPEALLAALRKAGRADLCAARVHELPPRAGSVAVLGARALERGEGVPAERLVPRYLRRPEAEEKRLAAAGSLDTSGKLE